MGASPSLQVAGPFLGITHMEEVIVAEENAIVVVPSGNPDNAQQSFLPAPVVGCHTGLPTSNNKDKGAWADAAEEVFGAVSSSPAHDLGSNRQVSLNGVAREKLPLENNVSVQQVTELEGSIVPCELGIFDRSNYAGSCKKTT